jgi:hypothetical protein
MQLSMWPPTPDEPDNEDSPYKYGLSHTAVEVEEAQGRGRAQERWVKQNTFLGKDPTVQENPLLPSRNESPDKASR